MPVSALKFAANLSWLYTDRPFLDRFEAAARDGFQGVECLFPHEHADEDIRARLQTWGLQLVLFNARPGDWSRGDRGLACEAGREDAFRHAIDEALERAALLDCPRIHVMAGLAPEAPGPDDPVPQATWDRYTDRLRWAAAQAESAGRTLMIEPINRRDMPGYLLTRQAEAHRIVDAIGSPALQVQMDLYHCQIVEGDLTQRLRHWLPTGRVGHLQLAGVPDRSEPDRGEVNHVHVLAEVARLGYVGWIGCEYRPRLSAPGGTSAGLAWWRALAG